MFKKLLLIFIVLSFSFSQSAKPDQKDKELWKKQKGERTHRFKLATKRGDVHFEIHGKERDIPYMVRVKEIVRQGAMPILDYFEYEPTTPIHFVLHDGYTIANGFATVWFKNVIGLFTHPPFGHGHLVTGEDYLKGLVLHELTHIVHMDQTRGFPAGVRAIFGSVGKWGGGVPRWFTEGLAVWAETKFTQGGRLRLKIFDYEVKSRLLDPNFCDRINCLDDPGIYPHGSTPYWMGSLFMQYLEDRRTGTIRCLVHENSDNVPFYLDDAFKKCTGSGAQLNFYAFRLYMLEKIRSENNALKAKIGDTGQWLDLNKGGNIIFQHGLIPLNNQFIFTRSGEEFATTVRSNFQGREVSRRFDFNVSQFGQVYNDHKKPYILLTGATRAAEERTRQIYRWNLRHNDVEKVATKAGGDYPFYLGDETFGFWRYEFHNWALYKVKNGVEEKMLSMPVMEELSFPQYIARENKIFALVFDKRVKNSYSIREINLKTKKTTIVAKSTSPYDYRGICRGRPIFGQKENLFFKNAKGWQRIPATDNLVALYGSKHQTMRLYSSHPGEGLLTTSNCVDHLKGQPLPILAKKEAKKPVQKMATESYPSLRHFTPRYWMLSYTGGSGENRLSAFTSVRDPRDHHHLSLKGNYFIDQEEYSPTVSYGYDLFGYGVLIGYDKQYYSSTLSDLASLEMTYAGITKTKQLGEWSLSTGLNARQAKENDFLGKRKYRSYSLAAGLSLPRLFSDDFIQYAFLNGEYSREEVEGEKAFFVKGVHSKFGFRLAKNLYTHFQGRYSKSESDSLVNGAIFGGGTQSMELINYHDFYGLGYKEAYGLEMASGRAQIEYEFMKRYSGPQFFPILFKRFSLLAGMDYLKTDFALIRAEGNFIINEALTSLHAGVRMKVTAFYFLPLEVDVLAVRLLDYETHENNQVALLFNAAYYP